MNSVHLIGNLATDVDLRDVGDEKKVASFLLAVNRGTRDGGADFVWVSAWDRQGELCVRASCHLEFATVVAVAAPALLASPAVALPGGTTRTSCHLESATVGFVRA